MFSLTHVLILMLVLIPGSIALAYEENHYKNDLTIQTHHYESTDIILQNSAAMQQQLDYLKQNFFQGNQATNITKVTSEFNNGDKKSERIVTVDDRGGARLSDDDMDQTIQLLIKLCKRGYSLVLRVNAFSPNANEFKSRLTGICKIKVIDTPVRFLSYPGVKIQLHKTAKELKIAELDFLQQTQSSLITTTQAEMEAFPKLALKIPPIKSNAIDPELLGEYALNPDLSDIIEKKERAKLKLFKRGFIPHPKKPLFVFANELTEENGTEELLKLANYILKLGGQIVVMGCISNWIVDFSEFHSNQPRVLLSEFKSSEPNNGIIKLLEMEKSYNENKKYGLKIYIDSDKINARFRNSGVTVEAMIEHAANCIIVPAPHAPTDEPNLIFIKHID